MTAVWMRARAELRSNWRAATALALMLGLAGGVVISSAAGARRTDSAYSRFLAWAHAPDAGLNVAASFGYAGVSPKDVRALPEVKSSANSDGFVFVSTTPSGRYLFIGQGAGIASPSLR